MNDAQNMMDDAPGNNMDISGMTYEKALEELEKTIEKLNSGTVPLATTVELFERGCLLRDHCDTLLSVAEKKVNKIIENQNQSE